MQGGSGGPNCTPIPEGPSGGNTVTDDLNTYLTDAYGDPWVAALFWYTDKDDQNIGAFGLLNDDNTPRPAFTAIQQWVAAHGDPAPRTPAATPATSTTSTAAAPPSEATVATPPPANSQPPSASASGSTGTVAQALTNAANAVAAASNAPAGGASANTAASSTPANTTSTDASSTDTSTTSTTSTTAPATAAAAPPPAVGMSAPVTLSNPGSGGGEQTAPVAGGAYELKLNEWGGGDPVSMSSDGGPEFKIDSSGLSLTTGVEGYFEIVRGCSWGGCTANNGAPFPVAVSMLKPGQLTSSAACSTGDVTGDWDNAYDI